MKQAILALFLLLPSVAMLPALAKAQETLEKATFRVKYIAQDVVYLDAGSSAGLKEGQQLIVQRDVAPSVDDASKPAPPTSSSVIASLRVTSVAAASAVCEIVSSTEPIQVGDSARLAPAVAQQDEEQQQAQRLVGGREYPQIITFTTGYDPVVEEVRASVPRPPSPEINRMRGRIGFEYSSVISRNTPSSTSSEAGIVARFEMSRIAGSYWNFNGYWRGRFTTLTGSAVPVTVSDLVNRTYTLNLEYNNPDSHLVAGGGRLYLPWATSLDTMDGGYVGRKMTDRTILGIFGGTTPDPASYDYNPQGKLGGTFVNVQGGSFEGTRYSTTFGLAVSAIQWHATRQFGFMETSISFKTKWSLYDATEVDIPHTVVVTPTGTTGTPPPPATKNTGGLNRSYLTLRYVPNPHIELQLNDTYFRDFPSFDPALIGTGLLDRYLFQGLSGGVRVNLPKKISVYTDLGKSSASGDTKGSWNKMYGLTFGEIWRTGVRADFRYSKFDSSFGSGDYKAVSLSRSLNESFQWQFQAGFQDFNSTLTTTTRTHFLNTDLDWSVGRLLFFDGGYTWQRGGTMNYDQLRFMVGKRF
ncbi:MAG TPA: hypothetical protein VJO53_05185 [Candidatus Acidoferrales bacterium]|nr:hypothetical protein [Candidatus Acidoferrales bacterium]